MSKVGNPVLLVILDGWGYNPDSRDNAIAAAATPTWDRLWAECPHGLIDCSGRAVGLPDGQMGNSEVGHMHIGAGRVIMQELTRISANVEDGEFYRNPRLRDACAKAARTGHAVHVLGLLSPGGVHSHEQHLFALLRLAAQCSVERIYLHAFLDGRDTPPQSAGESLQRAGRICAELPGARIASIVGRYYAMDRNKGWDRVALACDLLVDGRAEHVHADAATALQAAYDRGETDEFVRPTRIGVADAPVRMEDGDVVLFGNFRADRARQLTSALTHDVFTGFERRRRPKLASFVTMTDYGDQFQLPIAFPPVDLRNSYGEVIARHGLRQLRIAETEKYAHVTFFFNCGKEQIYPGEDRVLVPSPAVATYDQQPEMSAREVTSRLIAAITSRDYDTMICNYANADMVGHTGDFAAAVRAIETLDCCLGDLVRACAASDTDLLITSDHGNAEQMRQPGEDPGTTQPHTAHTVNLVPLLYVGREARIEREHGSLIDLAPTMLRLLGLDIPAEMTGQPLVRLHHELDRTELSTTVVAG